MLKNLTRTVLVTCLQEFKSLSTKRLLNIPETERHAQTIQQDNINDDPDDLVDPSVFNRSYTEGVFPTTRERPISRASVKAMMKFSAASAGVQSL